MLYGYIPKLKLFNEIFNMLGDSALATVGQHKLWKITYKISRT